MAEKAEILIRGRDETAQAWASVQANAANAIGQIHSLLPGLAAALSAAGLVAFAKQGIEAADRLNDLSKSTNITVENLSGLQLLAKKTGTDLDGLAKGINKMSVEMGKDPEKFRALGITATDNTEAFKQFADIFNTLPDINQRNALSQAVFGKSWAEIAPALSEGSKQIAEIIDRGKQLSGVTQEIAEQANTFNGKLAELTGTGALFNKFLAPALPLLNDLADSMLKAGENAGRFDNSFKPVAETLKAIMILGANVSFVFNTMGADIARAIENVKLIARGDFAGSKALGEMFRKDAESRRKELEEYEKRIRGLGLTGKPAPGPPAVDPATAADAAARAKAFLGTGAQGKDDVDEVQKFIDKQNELAEQLAAGYERTRALLGQTTEEAKVRYDTEFGKLAIVDDAIKANLITRAKELDAVNAANAAFDAERQAQIESIANQTRQAVIAAENAVAFGLAERERADAAALAIKQERDAFDQKTANVILSLATESEARQMHYDSDLKTLDQALGMELITIQQYEEAKKRLQNKYGQASVAQRYQEERQKALATKIYGQMTLGDAATFAGMMGELMQTKSRKMFEVGKAGAIAETIINTYASAVGAYKALASIPVVGPALGAAAAAAAVAVGMARVQAIKSTTLGSSGGAIGTFAASPSTGLPEQPSPAVEQVVAGPVQAQNLAQRKDINITILGEGMFSATMIRDSLIPLINDAVGDGVTLRATVLH